MSCSHRRCSSERSGLHHCGDALDVLHHRRHKLVISNLRCAPAAKSNTSPMAERVANGSHFRCMANSVAVYCAPADRVIIEQPRSDVHDCYRPADQVLQPWMFDVPHEKEWCLIVRGVGPFSPVATTDLREKPPHRSVCFDPLERERLRSRTDPRMARGMVRQINLLDEPGGRQPVFAEEIELLATGCAARNIPVPAWYRTPFRGDAEATHWLVEAPSENTASGTAHTCAATQRRATHARAARAWRALERSESERTAA